MSEQQKVYVVHLQITQLERGTNQSSKGNALTGLWVRGNATNNSGEVESWEKFLMDWNAADSIAAIERAGVGAQVDIRMLKSGRFWNIQSVTDMGNTQGATAGPPPQPAGYPQNSPQPSQQPPQEQKEMFKPSTENPLGVIPNAPAPVPASAFTLSEVELRMNAINKATDLTIGMMEHGILKGAKITPPIVYDGVIALANKIKDFLDSDGPDKLQSDTSPLEREPGCDDDKDDPGVGEDGIPF